MEKIPDKAAVIARQKVNVSERSLLVAHGQSKKLADMRKKLQADLPREAAPMPDERFLTGAKSEVAAELGKARMLIDDSINQIMRSFPEGKKNKLFSFRFGSVDALKAMRVQSAFKILGIDDKWVKMKLIAEMDFYGNQVKDSSG